jgi:hypothetical protein
MCLSDARIRQRGGVTMLTGSLLRSFPLVSPSHSVSGLCCSVIPLLSPRTSTSMRL